MPEEGKKRLLIVEDEELIRKLLVKVLSKVSEYQVVAACDGVEAVEILDREGPFDLAKATRKNFSPTRTPPPPRDPSKTFIPADPAPR